MSASRPHSPPPDEAPKRSTLATHSPSIVVPDMVATPTGTTMPSKMDFQSPMQPHARLASSALLATPEGKKALGLMLLEGATTPSLSLPMSCNFKALSSHFHLPLKVAAEKFGVRATAFKKRCRAIGIRHWPYRKVRSLKRSLQELSRCREQGLLNEKQHHQLHVFQSQLDKLLSAETYGIDPNGRFLTGSFEDDGDDNEDDSNGDDDDDMSCASNQSPRIERPTPYANFKIATLRTKRPSKKSPTVATQPHTMLTRGDFAMPPMGAINSGSFSATVPSYFSLGSEEDYLPPVRDGPSTGHHNDLIPSVSVRFAPHAAHTGATGLGGFEAYDPFFQDFKSEFTLTMEDFGGEDTATTTYGVDTSVHDDFFPFIRSPTMAAFRANGNSSGGRSLSRASNSTASTTGEIHGSEKPSESTDDDVFLHISPDYGCLV